MKRDFKRILTWGVFALAALLCVPTFVSAEVTEANCTWKFTGVSGSEWANDTNWEYRVLGGAWGSANSYPYKMASRVNRVMKRMGLATDSTDMTVLGPILVTAGKTLVSGSFVISGEGLQMRLRDGAQVTLANLSGLSTDSTSLASASFDIDASSHLAITGGDITEVNAKYNVLWDIAGPHCVSINYGVPAQGSTEKVTYALGQFGRIYAPNYGGGKVQVDWSLPNAVATTNEGAEKQVVERTLILADAGSRASNVILNVSAIVTDPEGLDPPQNELDWEKVTTTDSPVNTWAFRETETGTLQVKYVTCVMPPPLGMAWEFKGEGDKNYKWSTISQWKRWDNRYAMTDALFAPAVVGTVTKDDVRNIETELPAFGRILVDLTAATSPAISEPALALLGDNLDLILRKVALTADSLTTSIGDTKLTLSDGATLSVDSMTVPNLSVDLMTILATTGDVANIKVTGVANINTATFSFVIPVVASKPDKARTRTLMTATTWGTFPTLKSGTVTSAHDGDFANEVLAVGNVLDSGDYRLHKEGNNIQVTYMPYITDNVNVLSPDAPMIDFDAFTDVDNGNPFSADELYNGWEKLADYNDDNTADASTIYVNGSTKGVALNTGDTGYLVVPIRENKNSTFPLTGWFEDLGATSVTHSVEVTTTLTPSDILPDVNEFTGKVMTDPTNPYEGEPLAKVALVVYGAEKKIYLCHYVIVTDDNSNIMSTFKAVLSDTGYTLPAGDPTSTLYKIKFTNRTQSEGSIFKVFLYDQNGQPLGWAGGVDGVDAGLITNKIGYDYDGDEWSFEQGSGPWVPALDTEFYAYSLRGIGFSSLPASNATNATTDETGLNLLVKLELFPGKAVPYPPPPSIDEGNGDNTNLSGISKTSAWYKEHYPNGGISPLADLESYIFNLPPGVTADVAITSMTVSGDKMIIDVRATPRNTASPYGISSLGSHANAAPDLKMYADMHLVTATDLDNWSKPQQAVPAPQGMKPMSTFADTDKGTATIVVPYNPDQKSFFIKVVVVPKAKSETVDQN